MKLQENKLLAPINDLHMIFNGINVNGRQMRNRTLMFQNKN